LTGTGRNFLAAVWNPYLEELLKALP